MKDPLFAKVFQRKFCPPAVWQSRTAPSVCSGATKSDQTDRTSQLALELGRCPGSEGGRRTRSPRSWTALEAELTFRIVSRRALETMGDVVQAAPCVSFYSLGEFLTAGWQQQVQYLCWFADYQKWQQLTAISTMFLFPYLARCVEAEARWLCSALKKVRDVHIKQRCFSRCVKWL